MALFKLLYFYTKLVSDLRSYGFELNPYDPCVANKIIDGHQLTAIWHVDDMKISHRHPHVVDAMLEWLTFKYQRLPDGTLGDMKISRGKYTSTSV